jgi:predicted alpha/beta-fold hydrolase
VALGFSLGANILVSYLGENVGHNSASVQHPMPLLFENDERKFQEIIRREEVEVVSDYPSQYSDNHCEFLGAICLANPYSLNIATRNLHKTRLHKMLYDLTFIPRRKILFAKNIDIFVPTRMMDANMDKSLIKTELLKELKQCSSTREMDEKFTLPLYTLNYGPRMSLDEFYDRESCKRWIDRISIPTFLINAQDDPISPANIIPDLYDKVVQAQNKNIVFALTKKGGHSGWVDSPSMYWGSSWSERVTLELVKAIINKKTTQI